MSAEIELAGAITGLVAEKRALGYKYVCEERVLARFDAFCASTFPGLDTVTRASVEAWVACARRRAAKPATVNSLIAPVRELARWLHRRGVDAYVLPTGVLEKPARYIPHIYNDQELAALFAQTDHCRYCPEVPLRHLVMPGGAAGTPEIMRWIAHELSPETYVNLMAQYRPACHVTAKQHPEINRCITAQEFQHARDAFRAAGLCRLDHDSE